MVLTKNNKNMNNLIFNNMSFNILVSPKDLRAQKFKSVTKQPGFYKWYFKTSIANDLMKRLPRVDYNKLQHKTINNEDYVLLYVGIAKSLRERAKWHMAQKHTLSSIKSGTISTLRHTLSALNAKYLCDSEDFINNFMEENCYWEYMETLTKDDAHEIEVRELNINYYPLNIQENRVVEKENLVTLKALRKEYIAI